jgi:hypothetical protein
MPDRSLFNLTLNDPRRSRLRVAPTFGRMTLRARNGQGVPMQTRTRRSPRASLARAGEIWEACVPFTHESYFSGGSGVYVAEPDRPERPIAFIYTENELSDRDGLELAGRIAERPALLNAPGSWGVDPQWVIDLRRCGRLDSPEPVPGFLFSVIRRRPGDSEGRGEYVAPFCRFRLGAMLASLPLVGSELSILSAIVGPCVPLDGDAPAKKATPDQPTFPLKLSGVEGDRKAARGAA